jgi:hypothetical protein
MAGTAALTRAPSGEALFNGFDRGFLTTAQGKTSLYLAGAGLLVSAWKRPRFAFVLLSWVALLFLVANLDALGWLHSYVNNLSVEISLYMPLSALGGYAVAQAVQWLRGWIPPRWQRLYATCLALLAMLACWSAARQLVTILNPVTFLARQADAPALAWIQANIPRDETFLINPFSWGYGLYAGNDGGYWITPIAGQRTMPPAVLYGFDTRRERIRQTSKLAQQVIDLSGDAQGLHDLLIHENIQYIYIGARGGALSPSLLQSSPAFDLLYQQDGAWVFQVK